MDDHPPFDMACTHSIRTRDSYQSTNRNAFQITHGDELKGGRKFVLNSLEAPLAYVLFVFTKSDIIHFCPVTFVP